MGGPWKPWLTKDHGTEARARRHWRDGDKPLRDHCPACWQAERRARYQRRYGPGVIALPIPAPGDT